MATPNQWAIADVAVATAFDIVTGNPLFKLNNLKTSGLENSAKTVYVRGGRGNAKILGFSSDREARVTLQDATFTNAVMAQMTGNNLITGAQNVYKSEVLTVATNAAAVTKTPVGGTLAGLYKVLSNGGWGTIMTKVASAPTAGQYTLTGKNLAFSSGDLANGDKVIAFYKMATDVTASRITVSSNKFAGSFKLVLDCLVYDTTTAVAYAAQIEIPKCKMEDNWKFDFQAGGEPSVFDIPIEVLKDVTIDDMWYMTVYDEGLAT